MNLEEAKDNLLKAIDVAFKAVEYYKSVANNKNLPGPLLETVRQITLPSLKKELDEKLSDIAWFSHAYSRAISEEIR